MARQAGHRRWVAVAIAALAACLGARARAAEIRLDAEDACIEPGSIADEVEGVIGRPLTTVPGVTFEIQIARASARAWRLRLRTVDGAAAGDAGAPPRATRELEGASCAEVASAAAVAIAVSIQAAAGEERPAVSAAPPPPTPAATAPPAVVQASPPASPSARPRALAALLAVGDTGSLPQVGVGGELDVAVELGRARAVGLLSAFAPQETGTSVGGRFTLMFGGLLGCAAPRLARATLAACLGAELGRLAGEGIGATHPRLGSALWAAGRAELGLAVPVGPGWAVVMRGALTVPIVHPAFVVNGTVRVYEPAWLGGRFAAGAELSF